MNLDELEISVNKTLLSDSLSLFSQTAINAAIPGIPIVDIFRIAKTAYTSTRENLFLKKLFMFFNDIKDIGLEERVKFLGDYVKWKEQAFGEKLIIILDRLDDIEKAKILAKLFRASVLGTLSIQDFMLLANILDKIYIEYLNSLKNKINGLDLSKIETEALAYVGLLSQRKLEEQTMNGDYFYDLNENGRKMFEFGLI